MSDADPHENGTPPEAAADAAPPTDAPDVPMTDAADAAALTARGITELVHPDLTQDVPTYSSNNTVVD